MEFQGRTFQTTVQSAKHDQFQVGTWQLAVRFSSVDLNDGDISGGDADNFTLGINWFATDNIRFSANYVNVLNVDGGAGDNDEPETLQMRAQVEL